MYEGVNKIVRILKKIVPEPLIEIFRPTYHAILAFGMALVYGFPARKLVVIGVTGTKGKSTTAEMLFAILRKAGYNTGLISTIRFAINDESKPNLYKMTLQGRGFAQAFMRDALNKGCTHLIVEVTSESVLQYRHWFFSLNALVVTNIQREHIERHGSFENYVAAKRAIVETLARSKKPERILVSNKDIPETREFLTASVPIKISFGSDDLTHLVGDERTTSFEYKKVKFSLPIPGTFNAMNALAAIKLTEALHIPLSVSSAALQTLPVVRGRVEHIDEGQNFLAIVDYAHTPDSLRALYETFKDRRKICILGSTGGGRDAWKRKEMGSIADEECEKVILTNEDPYDEDPESILAAIAEGMKRTPTIIMDRREAIRAAIRLAKPTDAVLISGKGTDPYIMGPKHSKIPWSDAQVTREELQKFLTEV